MSKSPQCSAKGALTGSAISLRTQCSNLVAVGGEGVRCKFVCWARSKWWLPRRSRSAKSAGSTSTATVLKPAPAPKPARSPGTRGKATAKAAKPVNDTTVTAVVKDAARLLSWGRDWHELPEAIARIAGRPGVAQVRQILRGQREAIEERAGQQDKS